MVCRIRLPSSLPIRFSADKVFTLWRSSFVSLTLSMCSFFLVWKRRHVSPTHTIFWQAQGILYTTHFCLSPSDPAKRSISFIFLPGLNATRKECQLAVLLHCSDNPFKYGIVTTPRLSCSYSLLSMCWGLCSINLLTVSLGYPFATKTSSMLCSSSARWTYLSHKALALSAKPFL